MPRFQVRSAIAALLIGATPVAALAADVDRARAEPVAATPVVREVTVTVPVPAAVAACAKGKHIAKASLTTARERVELEDVVVTDCASTAGSSVLALRGHQKTGHVTLLK